MSYLNHFKLREQPFRLTPDPEFVYLSKQHARAKAYMESTIWLADGFVVITGEIGSGKTTLVQSFLKDLDDDVLYAVISQTQLNPTQFLQAILTEFGFKPFNMRKVELLDMLNMFLIEQYSNGKKVVLVIDEAQNLSHKVLEEVRMLSGVETHKEKVLRIILAGQPELKTTLESPNLKQLMQRIRLRFHLGPLSRQEVQEYVQHRLLIAGNENPALISVPCYELVYRYTGGLPRLVNTFCDTALLCAFAEEARTVEPAHFLTAAEELGWQEYQAGPGPYHALPPVAAINHNDKVAQIEVRANGEQVSVHTFPKGRVIIGRAPDNEIYIRSKFVSRHHAQLISDDDGCLIEDLNSTNGMFIEDRQVKRHRLRDGDVVSLGVHQLVYHDLRPEAARDDEASAAG